MTRRRKISIILLVVAFVLAAVSFGAVYAYNVLVRYNYNVKAETPMLTAVLSEDGATLTVTDAGGASATKCDVILTMQGEGALNGKAPDLKVFYTEKGTERVRAVYKNLALSGNSTSFPLANASDVKVLAVRPAEAIYNGETVEYRNAYVASAQDLKLLNSQENYNNPFEFIGNAFSKNTVAYVVCFIDDVTIEEPLTLNIPCSLDLLDRTLTLRNDLTIRHSYAGRFYLAGEKAIAMGDSVKITVTAPKGYYDVSETLGLNEQNFAGTFDFAAYGDEVLNDALNFAKVFFPARVYKSLLLPSQYQSFGVNLSYTIADTGAPFFGAVSADAAEGALQRKETTNSYAVTITAERGGKTRTAAVEIQVIGTGDKAFSDVLLAVLSQQIYAESEDTELLSALCELCAEGGFNQEFTLQIADDSALPGCDENTVKFIVNGAAAQSVQLYYDVANGKLIADAVNVDSFFLRRGALPLAENMALTVTVNSISQETNISVKQAIAEEALYYLRASSPAFITNQPYSVLNLRADGLYLGNTKLTAAKLNLTAMQYSLVTSDGTTDTPITATDYFTLSDNGLTLSLLTDQTEIPKNLYLKYECKFSGESAPRILKQRVVQAIPGSGGENTGFESNNPFDALFLSSEVNWLEGGTFEVPPTSPSYYANIEILSVGGETYSAVKHKLCYLTYSGNEFASSGKTYYKIIDFTTDRNYVPDFNTPVKVRCTYLESETDSVVLTQDYTFTIHGIFKCGDNASLQAGYSPYVFEDPSFYQMTISLLDAVYVSELSDSTRLILSDSKYFQGALDYSKFASSVPAAGVRLGGVERLANVPSMNFNGVKISDLSAFAAYEGSALKTLKLSNCALTDGVLYGNDAESSRLYALHLTSVDLSQNSITRTDKLLARTVADLNLAAQKNGCLSEIGGLENLMELVSLTLSENAIYRFETLKNLKSLKELKIDGNRLNDTMYGTDGELNVPVYVWMIKTNAVSIYAQTGVDLPLQIADGNGKKFSEGGSVDIKKAAGCVALNAFAMPTKLYGQEAKAQLESDVTGLEVSAYRFKFSNLSGVLGNSLTFIVDYADAAAKNGQCSYIVAATDLNGNVVSYREFLVTVYFAEVQA